MVKTNKRQKLKDKSKFFWVVTALFSLFILALIVSDVYVYRTYIQPNDTSTVTNLIINATSKMHKPVPVEAKTGNLYFPDAKLFLPPAELNMQVKYSNISDGKTPELQVTTNQIVDLASNKLLSAQRSSTDPQKQIDNVFDEVPSLQACTRGVQIFFSPQKVESPVQFKGSKKLANSKKLYFYLDSTCKEDLTQLLDYLKQAQSY